MSDNSGDPAFIAARELDATLQKLRIENATQALELKQLKEGKDSKSGSGTMQWVLAVVFAFLLLCLLNMCGRR